MSSITSKPLLNKEAESIVILLPIFQVGCRKQSAAVAVLILSESQVRKGPPEAVTIKESTFLRS